MHGIPQSTFLHSGFFTKESLSRGGAIALFAQTPFDKTLGCSNIEWLKYEWIWEKPMATGMFNCNYAPLKCHENILIFSDKAACFVRDDFNAMNYYPQMSIGSPYRITSGKVSENYDPKQPGNNYTTTNTGTRYPRDVMRYSHDKEGYHPTQKPVALLEYLIKTYTHEDDIVLDNCFGSGSTAIACLNTGRRFIGMELNQEYFDIAKKRIEDHFVPKRLF